MRNIPKTFLGIALLLTAITACEKKDTDEKEDSAKAMAVAPATSAFDKAGVIATIRAADELWARAVASKNMDSLMTMYASDAISMSDGSAAAKGTDAIRNSYAGFFKANPRDFKITSNEASFSDDGTVGYNDGSFSGTVDGPGGKPMKVSGDYVNVWKKEGGSWKILREISNSNAPPGK